MTASRLVSQFLESRDVLLAFIYSLTRDYGVAEEVFQEVSLVILEEARKEAEIMHFASWSREVARRRVAEYYRKSSRDRAQHLSETLTDAIADAFAEQDVSIEIRQTQMAQLLECLKAISGRSRQVIEKFYHQRRSVREIAQALGWQENSVKVALSRARKVLADCVQVRMSLRRRERAE
jgi:RNA polymerase sigma-70 factor, ECF subfamily